MVDKVINEVSFPAEEHDMSLNIQFLRLHRSLSQKKRAEVLDQFRRLKAKLVILITLRAGGVGLNLTMANHFVLIDPWWNPAVEDQTIEHIHQERIQELHQQKCELFESTINVNQEEKSKQKDGHLYIPSYKVLKKKDFFVHFITCLFIHI
eukprot:TRINITY_DN6249_c0_g2_i2.p1 TRINITY_DN6249_c0_g2~~TRINITY_DN6249_c0_g2_i2.p1  ORF type:complete len:151 (+),score=34.25 TRINITY_DN6249_c0_g2_i2:674-1126(+)